MDRGHLWAGVCGWDYRHWRTRFYPADLPQSRRLSYLAARVSAVEIDTTFYSLRRPSDFERWRDSAPPGFVFAVKGSRFITHMKRLLRAREALANFFASGPLALNHSLGPFLWQLPETLRWDRPRIEEFLALLPRDTAQLRLLAAECNPDIVAEPFLGGTEVRPVRHALEPRDPGFASPEVADVLREHGVALVMADSHGRWPTFDADTADFRYLRLHGTGPRRYSGSYQGQWEPWRTHIEAALSEGKDTYVFFDNDARAQAPRDAMALLRLIDGED